MSAQRTETPRVEAPGHTCDPNGGPIYDLRCHGCVAMLKASVTREVEAEREACIAVAREAVKPFEERLRKVIGRNYQLIGEQLSGARAVLRAVESRGK